MAKVVCEIVDAYVFRRTPAGPEFLVLRRTTGTRLGGTWQAVHGKIEPGETAWQAALREIREETQLVPARLYQLEAVNTFYVAAEDAIHHCPGFAAEAAADAEVRLNHEHEAYEWLPADEAIRRYTWPGQRRAVREILAEIIAPGPSIAFLEIPLSDEGGASPER